MKRDKSTYGSIGRKFDEWTEIQASRPPRPRVERPKSLRPYTPEPETDSEMGKSLFALIGFGIGAVLVLLALWALYNSSQWGAIGRDGAAFGYFLVGFFLLLAGVGGIAATYNHNYRVLANAGRGHGHSH